MCAAARTCNRPTPNYVEYRSEGTSAGKCAHQVKQKSETVDNNQLYRIVDSNRTQNLLARVRCLALSHHRIHRILLVECFFR